MTRKMWLGVAVLVAGLAGGCAKSMTAQASGWRTVAVDPNAMLTVRVEGGPAGHTPVDSSNRALEGQTTHRVLRNEDGSALFAYDLVLKRTTDKKQYKLLLLPAEGGGPTFVSKREVSARVDEDLVRVELMEQRETHEKIVDVYRLMAPAAAKELHSMSLMEMHNAVFRWIHGMVR